MGKALSKVRLIRNNSHICIDELFRCQYYQFLSGPAEEGIHEDWCKSQHEKEQCDILVSSRREIWQELERDSIDVPRYLKSLPQIPIWPQALHVGSLI